MPDLHIFILDANTAYRANALALPENKTPVQCFHEARQNMYSAKLRDAISRVLLRADHIWIGDVNSCSKLNELQQIIGEDAKVLTPELLDQIVGAVKPYAGREAATSATNLHKLLTPHIGTPVFQVVW